MSANFINDGSTSSSLANRVSSSMSTGITYDFRFFFFSCKESHYSIIVIEGVLDGERV